MNVAMNGELLEIYIGIDDGAPKFSAHVGGNVQPFRCGPIKVRKLLNWGSSCLAFVTALSARDAVPGTSQVAVRMVTDRI